MYQFANAVTCVKMHRLPILIVIVITFLAVACDTAEQKSSVINDSAAANANSISEIKPAQPPSNFKSVIANVNGINIHYVIG